MATITEKLKWLIEADAKSAIKGFEETGLAAEKGLGKAQSHTDKLAGQLIKTGAGLTAFAGIAGVALFKAAGSFEELALRSGKFADATGLNVEQASRFIEVAGDLGIGADTVETAIGKMNKTLGTSPDKFRALGVEIAVTKQGTEDVNGTFLNAIDRLNEIKNPAERAATAAKLFGKGWQGAAELISSSTDDIKARLAGVADAKVINQAELAKAKEFRDDLDKLHDSLQEFVLSIGQGALPVIGGFVKAISGVTTAIAGIDSVTSGAAGGLLATGAAMTGVIGVASLLGGQLLKLKSKWVEMSDASKLAVVGIGVAMLAYSINAQQAAKAQANLNEQFAKLSEVSNVDLYREFTDAIVKGLFASKNLDETLQGLAHTNLVGAERVRDYIKALIDAGTATAEQKKLYGDLSAAIGIETIAREDSTKATARYKDGTEAATAATKDETFAKNAAKIATDGINAATDEATRKTKAYSDALQGQLNKLDALYPKAYDAVKATQDYGDAQRQAATDVAALDTTLLDHKSTTEQVSAATYAARDSIEAAAEKYATLNGAAVGSEGAIRRQIESLTAQASALSPSSPLRLLLQQYIDQLAAIPSNISTQLQLSVSQGNANTGKGAPGYAPRGGSGPKLASGGIVEATPGGVNVTVGEGGVDEAIIPLDGQHALGGSSTTNNYVTIHAMGADAVVRASAKYTRRNGPGWRS